MPALHSPTCPAALACPWPASTQCWEPACLGGRLFGGTSLQEEIGGRIANYLGPRKRSQEVQERSKNILSRVKGMDLWDWSLAFLSYPLILQQTICFMIHSATSSGLGFLGTHKKCISLTRRCGGALYICYCCCQRKTAISMQHPVRNINVLSGITYWQGNSPSWKTFQEL